MRSAAYAIRERVHPLHRLRRATAFRRVERRLDVPIWANLHDVDWKVRVRLMRHLSYVVLRESPERGVVALLRALAALERPQRFWDVGANFGYYSWLLASCRPGLQVSLFEPDPSNVALIEETVTRARGGFRVHALAASSEDGEADFALDAVTGATGGLEQPGQWAEATIRVRKARLDTFVGERPVDLLKVDVEGHEDEVLAGAEDILVRDRPIVVYEAFDRRGGAASRLRELGYSLRDVDDGGEELRGENVLALPPDRAARLPELLSRLGKAMP